MINSSIITEINVQIKIKKLTAEKKRFFSKILSKWRHIFSKDAIDLGKTNIEEHRIVLEDNRPFKQPYRKVFPGMFDEIRDHIYDMLQAGVIRESESRFTSIIVLVRKKDCSLRFYIDYRFLNSKTRTYAFKLPRIDDILDTLSGSKFFSKLDLEPGYWQVVVAKEDKQRTAFYVGNLNFYECNRISFGLTIAPATSQQFMEKCMGDILLKE